jgi:hypothetical protein
LIARLLLTDANLFALSGVASERCRACGTTVSTRGCLTIRLGRFKKGENTNRHESRESSRSILIDRPSLDSCRFIRFVSIRVPAFGRSSPVDNCERTNETAS